MPGELEQAVRTVLGRCLAVQPGEELVVVVDPHGDELGGALMAGAQELGADPVMAVLPPRPERGQEPPKPIGALLAAADVYVAPAMPSISHTVARKAATEAGVRGATMPGATADMVARLMSGDFDAMARRSAQVAELLTEADEARLTCPHGTDLRLDLAGRAGIPDDGDLTAPAAFGNLPCGEGFVAPLGGEGTVAAWTAALLGGFDEPLRIDVRDGALAGAQGPRADELLGLLDAPGPQGRNLAELGVGTNERAQLTGNVLEDEKILGTAHVAFGASASFGGTVTVPVHIDVVVLDATLDVGGTRVVDAGRFVLA
jgi:leucyl aminopeptidase (aminopeptidase T)